MGNLLWALEFLQQYENFFGICSPVCGSSAWWLYGGANGDLLQEDLCHMLCFPGLLKPAPLSPRQTTADPCLHMRHSDIQRQRRSPNKMVGGAKSHLESNLRPPRDAQRVQTKSCVHQDPGKGAVNPNKKLSQTCLYVFESFLRRHGSAVICCGGRGSG